MEWPFDYFEILEFLYANFNITLFFNLAELAPFSKENTALKSSFCPESIFRSLKNLYLI